MPFVLSPARLDHAADGTPRSTAYGDVYHSAAGGQAQARHVFLDGNGLPARWRGRERFVVLETGFGLGNNFLATLEAWRMDPQRCGTLHFVSVEKHPLRADDLAPALRDAWPMLVPGMHRIRFDGGRVVLTLAFADIADALPQLRLSADALFLDGFSPERNPEMWSRPVLKRLARLAAPGAMAATWCVATEVRTALAEAGFECEKRPGFGGKREMLVARYRGATGLEPAAGERTALVVGAGIAGAAVCSALAGRGWKVSLVEQHAAPATEASGNVAGVFHPLVTADDSVFARLTRAAYLSLLASGLEQANCGALQLARNDEEAAAQQRALSALGYPGDYAECVDQERASVLAGAAVAAGGVWFARSGWLRPVSIVNTLLDSCGGKLIRRLGTRVASLAHDGARWIARDAIGDEIAGARVAILANAADALRLAPDTAVRLRRVRGQVTHLPGGRFSSLRCVVLRGGFLIPPVDGIALAGASFDFDDDEPSPRAEDHAGNLERLERIVPGTAAGLDLAKLDGRVGWRAVVPDRLPMIGAIEDERAPGLYGAYAYGSRGLLWASLGAELLASLIEGEPLPLEARLADALSPGRFARRAQARGR
jgi:tRNA 5-methylaminomethyl-2-thiouridine biosynthesis bifunctional protein